MYLRSVICSDHLTLCTQVCGGCSGCCQDHAQPVQHHKGDRHWPLSRLAPSLSLPSNTFSSILGTLRRCDRTSRRRLPSHQHPRHHHQVHRLRHTARRQPGVGRLRRLAPNLGDARQQRQGHRAHPSRQIPRLPPHLWRGPHLREWCLALLPGYVYCSPLR